MNKMIFNKKSRNYCIIFSIIFLILLSLWVFEIKRNHLRPGKCDRLVILCAGDSLTADSYPEWLQSKCAEKGIDVIIINKGVKGHTSGEYLMYMERQNVLKASDPDIILLQLGTNDVRIDADNTPTKQFIRNMNMIIQKMIRYQNSKGRKPRILISTIPPIKAIYSNFTQESVRRAKEEINPAIEQLAEKWNLIFIDNYKLFLDNPELLPDMHPSEEGYKAMAENWYKALVSVIHGEIG